ncbi:MAG: VIT domain-containing protein [Byssovorax sp.]
MTHKSFAGRAALAAFILALCSTAGCHAGPITPSTAPEGEDDLAFSDPPAIAGKSASGAPLSLTATDGTGLRLVELSARGVIEEPLAFTEIRLVFDNPEDRILEGNFSVTLPDGATLSRFAMRIGEELQEGEIVERQAARAIYEDSLHKRQDPALLEQSSGNEFTARVFPIPARGRKELILSYTHEVSAAVPYTLPLRGLPELGKLDVTVHVEGQETAAAELHREGFVPDADFRLGAEKLKGGAGLRSGNLALVRVRPIPDAKPDPLGSAIVLFDTSASRALGFEDQLRLLGKLVHRVAETAGADTPITVACYDQTTSSMFEGKAGSFGDRELRHIRARQAFGASDLGQALGWAKEHARAAGEKRVIVITDGVATAGDTELDMLGAAVKRLSSSGVERLDAIAVGGLRDEAALRKLATGGLAHDGIVADGAADFATIDRRLGLATRSGIKVEVKGARWSWPAQLDGAQPGDEVSIYADLPSDQPVIVSLDGVEQPARELGRVERPLLARAIAHAKIESLLARQGAEGPDPETKKEIIALSTQNRVISPYTSLLVLETDQDYARFGIDRSALPDLLTVSAGRIVPARRSLPPKVPGGPRIPIAPPPTFTARGPSAPPPSDPAPTAAPPPPGAFSAAAQRADVSARGNMWGSDPAGDAFGAGGLGLSGIGEGGAGRGDGIGLGSVGTVGHASGSGSGQGFGSGHGRIGGAHRTKPPQVRMGATQVSGRVPPEIIQRIVRQNFGRFRACYERGLLANANLQGRVSVRFMIDLDGSVSLAANGGSDLPDSATVACVVNAFRGLSFPQPEGGRITVVYPLMFSPGDGGGSSSSSPPPALPPTSWAPPPAAPPPPPPAPPPEEPKSADPYTGRFKTVMDTIAKGDPRGAAAEAFTWHRQEPGDVMALLALGESMEASGDIVTAARAYGSIIDLFPNRADLRRFAGERLERLGKEGLTLARDTYQKARDERPDHPASHRLLAFAELKLGHVEKAFDVALAGASRRYPNGRFAGVDRILHEDLGLIAAAWIKAEPNRRAEILAKVATAGGSVEDAPSLRFVLNWETDANDVDFHIYDDEGGHAYYEHKILPSGGMLYADVTTGYGPECFTIRLPKEKRSPIYTLQAHYYSRGPMGYGMGKLSVIEHDGNGGLTFDERPFVAMNDHAFVNLGTVKREALKH